MKAIVYKSTGSWYQVKAEDGLFYPARIKGIFKIDGFTSTNPVAVGDVVEITIEPGPEPYAMIEAIYPRTIMSFAKVRITANTTTLLLLILIKAFYSLL